MTSQCADVVDERRTVLVTGGAGFIGSHVVQALRRGGYTAVVYDDLSTGNREAVPDVPLVLGDVQDRAALVRACRDFGVRTIIHLAAALSVPESMRVPAHYYRTNVGGSIAVLDAAVAADVPDVVVASSGAVYGEGVGRPFREDDVPRPVNVYGETKLVVERALAYFAAIHGIRSAALRLFNVAGADPTGEIGEVHDPETHLLPELVAAAETGAPCDIYGDDYPTRDGTCIRDYVHVCDVASAFVRCIEWLPLAHETAAATTAVFNVASGRGDSVREVIAAVRQITGVRVVTPLRPRRDGDPASLVACCERIRAAVGWVPRHSELTTLVASTYHWQRSAIRRTWARAAATVSQTRSAS
jgi:UDP-glucose-4-epimerase GalE